jgi:hypothetical protein
MKRKLPSMSDPGLPELEMALLRARIFAKEEGRNPTYAQLLKEAHEHMAKRRAELDAEAKSH